MNLTDSMHERIINKILVHKKENSLTWSYLSDIANCPKDALRMAFNRGSVKEVYLRKLGFGLDIEDEWLNSTKLNKRDFKTTSSYYSVPLISSASLDKFLKNINDSNYINSQPVSSWFNDKGKILKKELQISFEIGKNQVSLINGIKEFDIVLADRVSKDEVIRLFQSENTKQFILSHKTEGLVFCNIEYRQDSNANFIMPWNHKKEGVKLNTSDIDAAFRILKLMRYSPL